MRELREETGLEAAAAALRAAGSIRFGFGNSPEVMDVALFLAADVPGEPVETEELEAPAWYDVADLPLDRMWVDNPHWLPVVLDGGRVDLDIAYDEAAERIVRISG